MMAFLHLPYYLVWSPRVLMICKRTHLVGYYGPEAVSDNFIMNRLYARLFYSTNSNLGDRLNFQFLGVFFLLVFLFALSKNNSCNYSLATSSQQIIFYIKIYIDPMVRNQSRYVYLFLSVTSDIGYIGDNAWL